MLFALPNSASAIIRNPPIIAPTATVKDAIDRYYIPAISAASDGDSNLEGHHQKVDCVLVVDDDKRLLGVVTERDLGCLSTPEHAAACLNATACLTIREVMKLPGAVLRESHLTDWSDAIKLLQQPTISYLPVVDDGDRLVGLVTQASIFRALQVVDPVDLSETVSERIAELRESEERWALAIEGTYDGIWDQNLVTGDHFLSPRCLEIAGYDYGDIDSFDKWISFVHPDDQPRLQTTFQAYLNREIPVYALEYRLRCSDGHYKWILAKGKALWDNEGNPIRAVGSITDIGDRKQSEELLRQSEARYRAMVENQTELISRFRLDGTLLFVNDTLCRYCEMTKEQLIGQSFLPFVYPDDRPVIAERLDALTPEHPVTTIENRVVLNGHTRWMQWTNRAFYDDQGNLVELQAVGRDIHEQKQAELALAQTTQQLEAFLNNSPAAIGLFDANGRYLRVNPAFANFLNQPEEEIVGKTFADLLPNSLVRLLHTRMQRLVETQYPLEVEDEILTNGSTRIFRSILFPAKPDVDKNGKGEQNPTTFWAIATDVTERKRIKHALQEKTEELDRFFSLALDLLCIADTDGYFHRLNHQWEKTLGYRLQDLEGSSFLDYVHPDDLKSTLDTMAALAHRREVHNFVNRYRCQDGSYRWIEWRSVPIGNLVYAAARDITDRKEAEVYLQNSEERFATVFHSNPSPGWITNLEGRFLEINESFTQFYGALPENLVGRTCTDLGLWDKREDQQAFLQILKTTQRLPNFEVVWRTQSGQPRTVLLSANISWINNKECVIGVLKDITDRKQNELELKQAQESAESANQAKSAFISYMKHELRSPLNAILGFARQLKQDCALNPKQKKYAITIEQSAKNLLRNINQVLDVAEFDYPQCYLNLRDRYVNGDRSPMAAKVALEELDRALARLPKELRSQLDHQLCLGEPRAIAQTIAKVSEYDLAIGSLLAEKTSNFQYAMILESLQRVQAL
ncbi:MAG: PAS domain S-box protein [Elainellaceae cyanobacterium]